MGRIKITSTDVSRRTGWINDDDDDDDDDSATIARERESSISSSV